ncbi:hypothetical protein Y1Q_0014050 [Alligator mississippiensis]|uniref:Uncharacterized protein n=1 Tax=Alligator mississippiensis TaxID=8496 RepID=A0A151PDY3_ALLMI|nr:hypothetical protein Y1Q_0014050 [Alligator mississippiensis]
MAFYSGQREDEETWILANHSSTIVCCWSKVTYPSLDYANARSWQGRDWGKEPWLQGEAVGPGTRAKHTRRSQDGTTPVKDSFTINAWWKEHFQEHLN